MIRMPNTTPLRVLLGAGLLLSFEAVAQDRVGRPVGAVRYDAPARPDAEAAPSFRHALKPARTARMAAVAATELAVLSERRNPPLIGIHRDVDEGALAAGEWETTPDGARLYRVAIASPGARGLRVWFSEFSIGEGKLWVRGAGDDADREAPYSGKGEFGDGQFWSASVSGDTLVIEYQAADRESSDLPFRVSRVSHKVIEAQPEATVAARLPNRTADAAMTVGPLAETPAKPKDPALACNVDVTCYSQWADSARGVGLLEFEVDGGKSTCSGSLIRTRNDSNKAYLLTASHCIDSETTARSMEVFWNYATSQCIGEYTTERGTLKSNKGSSLVRTSGVTNGDSSIVLLKDLPSGVRFLDWDIGLLNQAGPVTGIHHPAGSMKKISHGNRVPGGDVIIDGLTLPEAGFYRVDWRVGVAEGGSSGSPLFDAPGVITGILSYGPGTTVCETNYAAYGRVAVAYDVHRDILEDIPTTNVAPDKTFVEFFVVNGVSNTAAQTIRVTTASAGAVRFNIRPDADWIQVSTGTATTSASAPATFTITVDPKKLLKPGAYVSSVSVLNSTAPPTFVTVQAIVSADSSRVMVSATPNPVPRTAPDVDGAQWRFTIDLREMNGVETQLTGVWVDGIDYSSQILNWFGLNQMGAGGRMQAPIRVANLVAPTPMFWEFAGKDNKSGRNWSQTVVINFE